MIIQITSNKLFYLSSLQQYIRIIVYGGKYLLHLFYGTVSINMKWKEGK